MDNDKEVILGAMLLISLLYPTHIPSSSRTIFLCICRHPGLRMVDIHERTKLPMSLISRQCQELERLGLIRIKSSPDSRREKNLYCGDRGEKITSSIVEICESLVRDLSKSYPRSKRGGKSAS